MSETPKFTPGPWYVGAMNDALIVIDQPPRPSTDNPNHEAKTQSIAIVTIKRDTYAYEANAHLIAAAPDLYAVVQEMVTCLDEHMVEQHDSGGLAALGITHSDEGCSLCKARRVLAKAVGRS